MIMTNNLLENILKSGCMNADMRLRFKNSNAQIFIGKVERKKQY